MSPDGNEKEIPQAKETPAGNGRSEKAWTSQGGHRKETPVSIGKSGETWSSSEGNEKAIHATSRILGDKQSSPEDNEKKRGWTTGAIKKRHP